MQVTDSYHGACVSLFALAMQARILVLQEVCYFLRLKI
jgi:hypothetical protein